MLVLSRKVGEEIRIGQNITVRVRRVHGNRVAIGVEAPSGIRILRGELREFAEQFDESDEHPPEATDISRAKANRRSSRPARQAI